MAPLIVRGAVERSETEGIINIHPHSGWIFILYVYFIRCLMKQLR